MRTIFIVAFLGASCGQRTETTGNQPAAAPPSLGTAAARPPLPGGAVPRAASTAAVAQPTVRAKQLLDTQLAALSSDDAEDALLATFAKDAIVLVPDARAIANPVAGFRAAIAKLTPHEILKASKVTTISAGGSENAVWLSAELALTVFDGEPEQKPSTEVRRVRITELATAETGWKVVAAAATVPTGAMPSKEAPEAIASATDAGPLAALLASPTALDKAMSADPAIAVFGTDDKEIAFGPAAAHALLAKWKTLRLSLEGKPREVHGKTWGYVQANVNWQKQGKPYPARLSAMLVAVPTAEGSWSVVAVQYAAQ